MAFRVLGATVTILKPLFERTSYLLKDQIIYNDAMDMEACSIPYSLKEYAWNRYPDDDPEWLFMLSRQSFLVDLAQAYALTKKNVTYRNGTACLLILLTMRVSQIRRIGMFGVR